MFTEKKKEKKNWKAITIITVAITAYIIWLILEVSKTMELQMAVYMVLGWMVAIGLFIAAGCCHEE